MDFVVPVELFKSINQSILFAYQDDTFDDTALNWDDDMFQISDEENTFNINVNNCKPSSSKKIESKKSLFDSKCLKKPTEKGEMDKTSCSTDTSIRSVCNIILMPQLISFDHRC